MTTPFLMQKDNYKKIRLCNNTDYERINVKNYVEGITKITNQFSEHCVDNWNQLKISR